MDTQTDKKITKKRDGSWLNILLLIIPYFIIVGVFHLIGYLIIDVDFLHSDVDVILTTQQDFIISLFGCIGTFIVLGLFMKYVDKERFVRMGFHIKSRGKDILIGLLAGLIIMGGGYLLLLELNEITYLKTTFNLREFSYCILVFVFVSLSEEMLFRGYVLQNLMYSFNKYVALFVSALLFSLMHGANPSMDWFSFTSLFSAGILLGVTYIYTKNLWFPIAFHFSWNFFQSIFGFKVSGQNSYSVFNFDITQNNRLNGGDFGFEGSYFSLIAEILLIIGIFYHYKRKQNYSET